MNSSSSNPHKPFIPPLLGLAVGIFAASTAAIFIRYAQSEADSLVIAAFRLSLATLLILPIALVRHRHELAGLHRNELGLALLSGFFLALHFATWISSLRYTTVANSVVLVSTTPLWVALLGSFTLREHLGQRVWLGLGMALVGGVVVGVSDACAMQGLRLSCPPIQDFIQGQAFLGDMLALVGAIMGAAYLVIGRRLRHRTSLLPYIFVVYGMAALVLVILAAGNCLGLIVTGSGCRSPWSFAPETYLWFLLLAVFPQLIGHSSFNWALRYLSAAYVSITLLGEPIGSTILAFFLLGETPTVIKVFGAILILLGIYVTSQSEKPKASDGAIP